MNKIEWRNSLKDEKCIELFSHMPDKVFESARIRQVKKNRIVVEKEHQIKDVLLCCQGQMQVRNEFRNGMVYNFDYTEPISYIGVMELLAEKNTYSAYLQAKTDCEVLVVPMGVFFEWFYQDQWLMLEVLKFMAKGMYERSFNSGEHRIYPANYQIIRYLIENYELAGKEEVFLEISKEEIGTLFCISTRTVHRTLKVWKEADIITVNRRGIGIRSDQYKQLCEICREMRNQL